MRQRGIFLQIISRIARDLSGHGLKTTKIAPFAYRGRVIEVTVCKDRRDEPFSISKKTPRIPPVNKVHASDLISIPSLH